MTGPAEGSLLAAILGGDERAFDADRLRAIDWTRLVTLAHSHSAMPMVDRALPSAGVPDDVRRAIHGRARAASARNLVLVRDLVEAFEVLEGAHIPAVPFKGPMLAEQLYGDIGLRPSVDIDLIVRRTDALAARAALESIGYRGGPRGDAARSYLRYSNEFSLVREADGRLVELQWAIAPAYFAFDLELDPFFDSLGTTSFAGREFPALAQDDLLLLLLAHGGKHLWERLTWIGDVARFVRRYPQIGWARTVEAARAARMLRMTLVGLRLAKQLDPGIDLDPEVMDAMRRDPAVEGVSRRIWRRTLSRDPSGEDRPFRILDLRMRDSATDAATYCVRLAVTPTQGDRDWLALPPRMDWAYLPLRPVRLGLKYGRRAMRGSGDRAPHA